MSKISTALFEFLMRKKSSVIQTYIKNRAFLAIWFKIAVLVLHLSVVHYTFQLYPNMEGLWALCNFFLRGGGQRQPTPCFKVLTVYSYELGLFLAKAFALHYQFCCEHDIAAIVTIFNVLSFVAVWGRVSNPSPTRIIQYLVA